MRQAHKSPASLVLTESLRYINGRSNSRLRNIILHEQKNFCAYTDEIITRTDAADIDHFNPTLKNTAADSYANWFVVKHQWNKQKSRKWEKFQPVLMPTTPDFEARIIYDSGDYITSSSDIPANNLIELLNLDNPMLAENRKNYIRRIRSDIKAYGQSPFEYFTMLVEESPACISYPRAIREEFGIDVFNLIA